MIHSLAADCVVPIIAFLSVTTSAVGSPRSSYLGVGFQISNTQDWDWVHVGVALGIMCRGSVCLSVFRFVRNGYMCLN